MGRYNQREISHEPYYAVLTSGFSGSQIAIIRQVNDYSQISLTAAYVETLSSTD